MAKKPKHVKKLDHQGCKIEIVTHDVTEELKIDAKTIETSRDADTGAYVSPEAPYQAHGSLEELGKAIADIRQVSD